MHDAALLVRALTLCVVVVLVGCVPRRHAGAVASYDLGYRRSLAGDAAFGGAAQIGARIRFFTGPSRPGETGGIDLAVGAAHPSGVVFRGAVYPGGLAMRIGSGGIAGVVIGGGISGISKHVPFALEVPAEAFASVHLGHRVALGLWAQPGWLPFADRAWELRTGLTVRVGKAYQVRGFAGGGGWHLGLLYTREVAADFVGVTIGYDFDVATP